jgi:hypothetical protein
MCFVFFEEKDCLYRPINMFLDINFLEKRCLVYNVR